MLDAWGKSLARPASLAWVNGRHSRTLPKRLLADAVAAMWDPNKLAMEDELILIDVRINDALSRLERGDSGAVTGEEIRTACGQVRTRSRGQRRRQHQRGAGITGTGKRSAGEWARRRRGKRNTGAEHGRE